MIEQSVGRYKILEVLGEGGMATVYKAFDTQLEREVAIKFVHHAVVGGESNEVMLKRFRREAHLLARLNHPHIVTLLDYGEYEGQLYLVTTYVSGGSLKKLLGRPIPWDEAARLLAPVARALEYAHAQDILHRDIKPANILLSPSGLPVLADFGIAKVLESITEPGASPRTRTDLRELSRGAPDQLTRTDMGIGTPDYMAPEQVRGKADVHSDIYSLGVVFYEMLTGRRPFIADTPLTVLLMHVTDPLPSPRQIAPDLPPEVEKVIFKALEKEPGKRYQTMGEFAQVLENLAAGKLSGRNRPGTHRPQIAFPPEKKPQTSTRTDRPVGRGRDRSAKLATGSPKRSTVWIRGVAGLLVILVIAGLGALGAKTLGVKFLAPLILSTTSTPTPTLTFSPSLTPTPTQTATPRPTPTFSAETLVGNASPICEQAFQSSLTSGSATSAMLFLLVRDYESENWQYDTSLPHLWASSSDQVHNLVCIRETRQQHGTYNNGDLAYRRVWDVRLVSWPDGRPFARNTFTGENAPFVKVNSGDGYGAAPIGSLLEWLVSLLHDRSIIYLGKGISSLAFSPDGNLLLFGETTSIVVRWSGTYQGTTKLWDLNNWSLSRTLLGHAAVDHAVRVTAVAFSPDGRIVASGGTDATTLLWNPTSGTILRSLPGRDQTITYIVFSPDGSVLVTLDQAGNVTAWNPESGAELWTKYVARPINATDSENWTGTKLAFTPDGALLAVASTQGVLFLDALSGEQVRSVPVRGDSLAISPDGHWLAVGEWQGSITLVNMDSDQQRVLTGHTQAVKALVFSPDSSLLASSSRDATIILWDVQTGQLVRTLFGHTSEVWTLAFSPDGSQLASGSDDGTVRLWDLK